MMRTVIVSFMKSQGSMGMKRIQINMRRNITFRCRSRGISYSILRSSALVVSLCVPSGPGIVVAGPLSFGKIAGGRSSLSLLYVDFDLLDARYVRDAMILELQAVHAHLFAAVGKRVAIGQLVESCPTLSSRVSEISLV